MKNIIFFLILLLTKVNGTAIIRTTKKTKKEITMEHNNNYTWLTSGEACDAIHVSRLTLYRWEKEGRLHPVYTDGGHRRYNRDEVLSVLGMNRRPIKKLTIGYCRVSTADQKKDLQTQIDLVSQYCTANGYQFKIISDIGSGINYNKKGLQELIHLISTDSVERVVINYKDRLIRFGYELIEQLCNEFGVEIEIINQTENLTSEEELVDDVLSIITVFSAKLYGSRSHKNKEIVDTNKKLFEKE